MKTIKGPGIFLAQFADDTAPFDTLDGLAGWVARLGFAGVQIPTWDDRLIDIQRAAESQDYCDEIKGILAAQGLELTELCSHPIGHMVAVHPAYDRAMDHIAPPAVRGDPAARQAWAVRHMEQCAEASHRLGLTAHVTFSGSLLWPYLYPGMWRPAGIIDEGFAELTRRWRPLLDRFDVAGVDVCYEVHAGEDIHDGRTFERFLDGVNEHSRCRILFDPSHFVLQQLDYLEYIDLYHEFIRVFHVKDAEFAPTGRQGTYGGYANWVDRAARFRSLGDGDVDFAKIFSKLTAYGYDGWATLEWECCLKHPEQGAAEGAAFIRNHVIRVADRVFASDATPEPYPGQNRADLGLTAPRQR
ncbi:MAG: sugar phosphate isomerase/epimerase family protein [Azospirillaceae bacterium]